MKKSFIENVNAVANATTLATGSVVEDTQAARDEAVKAAEEASKSATESADNQELAHKWADAGHNIPVIGTQGVDAEYSSYHWAVESSNNTVAGRMLVINDNIISGTYTWSSQLLSSKLNNKSDITHRHDNLYEPIIDKNTAFNKDFSTATPENGYSTTVARSDHKHDNDYEPKINVKGTAFNKDFGTTAGTVMEGNRNFDDKYMPKESVNTAYNKNFVVDINNPQPNEIQRGNHGHKANKISYDNSNTSIGSSTVQGAITEVDGRLSNIVISEPTYITALSATQFTQPISAQNTATKVTMPMPTINGKKNADNNADAEFTIKYPDGKEPSKNVEGTYTVNVSLDNTDTFALNLAVDGVIKGEAIVGKGELSISQFITNIDISGINGVSKECKLSFWLTNLDSSADAVIKSANAVWNGAPAGALVASGISVDHHDLTGTGAPNGVHTISDILDLQSELDSKTVTESFTTNNFAAFDSNGNLIDSNIPDDTITAKMDIITTPVADNIVVMDSNGNSLDGGKKISDLANVNGDITQQFDVKDATGQNNAVNKKQLDALSNVYSTISDLDAHESATNPHNITPTLIDAANKVHTHSINDVDNLNSELENKYDKVSSAPTGNIVVFGAGDVVSDSGTNISKVDDAVDKTSDETIDGKKTFTSSPIIPDATAINEACTLNQVRGFKNYIINGGFDVWQRGTNFNLTSNVGVYTADRWFAFSGDGGGITIKSLTSSQEMFNNVLNIGFSAYISGSNIQQRIENVKILNDETATLSFYSYGIDNSTTTDIKIRQFFNPDTVEQTVGSFTTEVGVWKRHEITFKLDEPSSSHSIGEGNYLGVMFMFGSSTGFSLANVQLEKGSVATPFEQRPYGLELSLCQRYYESRANGRFQGYATTDLHLLVEQNYSVPMRAYPNVTITKKNSINSTNGVEAYNTNGTARSMTLRIIPDSNGMCGCDFSFEADAEIY